MHVVWPKPNTTHLSRSFCSPCLRRSFSVCLCVYVCEMLWTFFNELQLKALIVTLFLSAWNHARPVGFPDLTLVLSAMPTPWVYACVCACECVFLSCTSCEIPSVFCESHCVMICNSCCKGSNRMFKNCWWFRFIRNIYHVVIFSWNS